MPQDSAPKRKQISTRTRFEIFKRDGFVCQYCGAHPPNVVLHVDHIIAVARGGDSNRENLTTACDTCNRGKAAVPLSSAPRSLAEQAAAITEAEKQLKGYRKIIKAQQDRRKADCWTIIHIGWPSVTEWYTRDIRSIQKFIDALGFEETSEAMEIAKGRFPDAGDPCWKYFCGVCWNKIKQAEAAA